MYNFIAQTAAAPTTLDDITPFINLGLGGIWLVAFLRSWIVPGSRLQEERKERLDTQERYDKLVETIQTKILPELETSRHVNEELLTLLRISASNSNK